MTTPAGTRDRILDASLRVMGEHGIAGVTNRRVAAAAGLSLGSLTYHFPSQTALLRAGLTRFVADEIARIETLAEGIGADDGVDGATAAVERTLAAMTVGVAELGVYEVYLQAARDPELRAAARDCFGAYEALAATLLGRLGVPHAGATAPHVVALVLGAPAAASRDRGRGHRRNRGRTRAAGHRIGRRGGVACARDPRPSCHVQRRPGPGADRFRVHLG